VKLARDKGQTSFVARLIVFCSSFKQSLFATYFSLFLNIMHSYDVFHSTFVKNLKRTLINLEFVFELASKRIRLLTNQLLTSFYLSQDEHPK